MMMMMMMMIGYINEQIETIVDVELTLLQKQYYRAIYERNRTYLEHEGSSMAQLVSIVVCSEYRYYEYDYDYDVV